MKGKTESQIKLDHPDILKFLFHPRKETESPAPPNCENHTIPVGDGVMIGGRFHLAEKEAPTILFFHGNGEIVSDYDALGPFYTERGMSFLAVDYRGYGWSTGEPTASAMFRDAHAIFEYVKKWLAKEGRTGKLVVMGRSLGSACAIELASTEAPTIDGLIVESGFASTVPLLECLGVDVDTLGITEEECFNNQKKIAKVFKPTFILHAQYDQFIPVNDAASLQSECLARSKEFQTVPGADHNTIIERAGKLYFDVIRGFVNKIGMPERRRRRGVKGSL
jgi:hypothetical protein